MMTSHKHTAGEREGAREGMIMLRFQAKIRNFLRGTWVPRDGSIRELAMATLVERVQEPFSTAAETFHTCRNNAEAIGKLLAILQLQDTISTEDVGRVLSVELEEAGQITAMPGREMPAKRCAATIAWEGLETRCTAKAAAGYEFCRGCLR